MVSSFLHRLTKDGEHVSSPIDRFLPFEVENSLKWITEYAYRKMVGYRFDDLMLKARTVLVLIDENTGIG